MEVSSKTIKLIVWLTILISGLHAGTTGKLVGTITDKSNGDALIGVNVELAEAAMGAATDFEGYYLINNIPPGTYTVRATYFS